ncbi:MAG: hypothetical protein LBL13_01170 [Bacteroidales bacterium]|jgi:transposase|nr:hypothetical protein [Bacteroidales bacterium]
MGFIREPKGVDFVIDSGVLSDADREEISSYIREYRLKAKDKKVKSKKSITASRRSTGKPLSVR